ncbi:hypothetical protein GGS21DRAFT_522844 [Xylaria nigripes]|nr:hypothetical protein GGS21DRAFT_522844 [Xylaria nigripes]
MTERHLIESAIGLAGRLSHIPYGTDKAENCGWHFTRNLTQNAPVFRALGLCKTWIPAEPRPATDSLPQLWEQKRRQKRWLVKSYPEASLDGQVVNDFLAENASLPQEENDGHSCFLSLGELTNTSTRRVTGIPLVVTVTGAARNVLRLARLDQEQWTWERFPNVAVRLSGLASEKPTLWTGDDPGSIHRVKCLVNLQQYNPTRWLAVQRASGTTILQPEYRGDSLDGSLERDASRIAANPLFHLWKEQTGGNTHADVSFNPGTRSKPPEVAIIDEQGVWSVWDIGFRRVGLAQDPVPKLRVCGHISHGILEQLPYKDQSDMRWHKVLWVGSPEDNSDMMDSFDLDVDTEDSLSSQATFPPVSRSSSLLVYNSQQVRLFDLTTNVYLPDLVFSRNNLEYVLDVQTTHDPQYFCVLTTSKLFVIRAYSKPGVEFDRPEKVWSILYSTPHFRNSFDHSLKLAITQGVKLDQATYLVFLYTSTNPWTASFYLEVSPTDPNKVRCQPSIAGFSELQNTILNNATRTLSINPTHIVAKAPRYLTKTGLDLANKKIRVYQIIVLRSDMSLISALCAFSSSASIQIGAPNHRVNRQSRAERKRGGSKNLRSKFVVDDDAMVISEDSGPLKAIDQRYVKGFYEHLGNMSTEGNNGRTRQTSQESFDRSYPFNAVHLSVDESLTADVTPPTRTFLQIMPNFKESSKTSFSAVEWEDEIGRLNSKHPSVAVYSFDLLRSSLDLPLSASLQEAYSRQLDTVNASLHHRSSGNASTQHAVATSEQIAYDLYLSLYGIGSRGPTERYTHVTSGDAMQLDSQIDTLPSSPPRSVSGTSTMTQSQGSNFEATESEDPAMALLRSYTGTGRFVPEKKFELLDKWQLGAEASDYVFDLDRNDDARASKQRRMKQLAHEERKRRRAESFLQLPQDSEFSASQPGPSTSFSTSQSRGVDSQRLVIKPDPSVMQAMSQPTAGTFGWRPSKKVQKRKGGFR